MLLIFVGATEVAMLLLSDQKDQEHRDFRRSYKSVNGMTRSPFTPRKAA